MTVHGSDGPGFEFRYGQKNSSPRRLPGCGGCFLEGETQNSYPSSADLKNVWRYTSTPPTFLRGVHMDYQGGDTREQVTGR